MSKVYSAVFRGRECFLAGLAIYGSVGCSSDANEPTGRLYLPLSAEAASGNTYQLSPARFRITGDQVNQTIDASGLDALDADYPVGDYSIQLLSDWQLNRLQDGVSTPVLGVMLSENPQAFVLTDRQVTDIYYRFGVGDEFIAFGDGRARVHVEVEESCTPTAEVCDDSDNDCDDEIDEGGVCTKRVFVSKATHNGDFDGVAGMDAFCQTQADEANLGAAFWALISTNSVPSDPFPRIVANGGGPFVTMSGEVIAQDVSALSAIGSGNSVVPELNQFGQSYSDDCAQPQFGCPNIAWIGNEQDCTAWTTTSGTGALAMINGALWFHGSYNSCTFEARVYCVEK